MFVVVSIALLMVFQGLDEIIDKSVVTHDGSRTCNDFVSLVRSWLSKIQVVHIYYVIYSIIDFF